MSINQLKMAPAPGSFAQQAHTIYGSINFNSPNQADA
jgi:hypothetical protein